MPKTSRQEIANEFFDIECAIIKAMKDYGPARSSFEDEHLAQLEKARVMAWRMVQRMNEERLRHPY